MTTLEDTQPILGRCLSKESVVCETIAGSSAYESRPYRTTGLNGLNGSLLAQALLRGELSQPYVAEAMDFAAISAREGEAIFQGTPQIKHLHLLISADGGRYATPFSSAFGCAVYVMTPAGCGYTATELFVNLVCKAFTSKDPLRTIAKVLYCDMQLASAKGHIADIAGDFKAHAASTYLVFAEK
jgi:acyl-coenzyme A thioesterase PaaI-like protein